MFYYCLCVSRTGMQCCCAISTQLELIALARLERTLRVSPTTFCHMSPRYMDCLPKERLDKNMQCIFHYVLPALSN